MINAIRGQTYAEAGVKALADSDTHLFLGWYGSETFSGDRVNLNSVIKESTLYAKWIAIDSSVKVIITASSTHTVRISIDGKLYVSGSNSHGQLGLGTITETNIYTEVDITHIEGTIIQVIAGDSYTIILTDTGKVYATGDNSGGQLGLVDLTIVNTFTQINTTHIEGKIISISTGNDYTFILTDTGKIYATGDNSDSQLGIVDVNIVNIFTQIDITHIEGKIISITTGDSYTIILTDTGNVYVTGNNSSGQLGIVDINIVNIFTKIDITHIEGKIILIVAGHNYTFILTDTGKVYATGDNSFGQLGNGSTISINIFTQIDISYIIGRIIEITVGYAHTTIMTDDGKIYTAGSNALGQLGLGDITDTNKFIAIDTSQITKDIVDIIVEDNNTFIIDSDGKLYAVGDNSAGQLGTGGTDNKRTPTLIADPENDLVVITVEAAPIALGMRHPIYLADDGRVFATGDNSYGALGINAVTSTYSFTEINIPQLNGNVIAVTAGSLHSVILTDTGKVYATGANLDGGLGLGDNSNRYTFTLVDTSTLTGKVILVAAGGYNTFLLTDRNNLYATGYGVDGQLGLGNRLSTNTFTLVNTSNVSGNITSIAAGDRTTFLLTDSGQVYATGFNDNSQLGVGDSVRKESFTLADTSAVDGKVLSVSAGEIHTILLSSTGKIYGTGGSDSGQLGSQIITYSNTFKIVSTMDLNDPTVSISAGRYYSLIKTNSGKVYATGANGSGQLGVGDSVDKGGFTPVNFTGAIRSIVASDDHTAIMTSDNKIYSTGRNTEGQLGLNDNTNRESFTLVDSI
jgi:alpha-tubulin suppressor-like RCC1 family protein